MFAEEVETLKTFSFVLYRFAVWLDTILGLLFGYIFLTERFHGAYEHT